MEVLNSHGQINMAADPKQHRFEAYVNNGGTVLAIAGENFAVVAGDTRMSTGYAIHTRYAPKTFQLTNKAVIATSGMQADQKALHKLLATRIKSYEYVHRKKMSTPAIAQMLANTLYYKRFFPYYTFNVLGGIDEQGRGCVYSYDAVGSYERVAYSTSGSGSELIQPLLDNQVARRNQKLDGPITLSLQETIELVKDALSSAAERDIYTGDFAEIYIITQEGIRKEDFELKHD
jgi:20S proteasome subunit beta 6